MIEKYFELINQGLKTLSDGNAAALTLLFFVLVMTEFGIPFPFILQGVRFYIGYEIGQGSMVVLLLIPIFVLGRQFGSAILYWLAHFLGASVVNWYHKRSGRMKHETERIEVKLQSKAPLAVGAVIFGRITPGLLVPTSLASAVIGLNYGYFALGVLISSIIFDVTFISLAAIFGRELEYRGFNIMSWLILACFISLTCVLWVVRWLRIWRAKYSSKLSSSSNSYI